MSRPSPSPRRSSMAAACCGLALLAVSVLAGVAVAQQRLPPAEQRPVVSTDELDRAIDETIGRPRFSWRLPRDRVPRTAEDAGWLWEFMRNLGKWAEKALSWLERIAEKIVDWLEKIFGKRDRSEHGPVNWREPVQAILFLLAAVAASALGVLLYRLWKNRARKPGEVTAQAMEAVPDIEGEDVSADLLPADEWSRLAEGFLARGELRLALRAMFFACLSALARAELITLAKHKSNRDYVRELDRRIHAVPLVSPAFQQNVTILDRVWYGLHEVSHEMLTRFTANHRCILEPPIDDHGIADREANDVQAEHEEA